MPMRKGKNSRTPYRAGSLGNRNENKLFFSSKAQLTALQPGSVSGQLFMQRQCTCGKHTGRNNECDECKNERQGLLQGSATNTALVSVVPLIVHHVLSSPGQLLDTQTCALVVPRFGHDFSPIPVRSSVSETSSISQTGVGDDVNLTICNFRTRSVSRAPSDGIYGKDGAETKPGTGSGSRVVASLPKQSKKTVTPLTKGDCGKSDWVVQWELDKKTPRGGWVVQKVELSYDVKDCSDKAVDPTKRSGPKPARFPFWEAWQINKSKQVTTYAETGDVKDDEFEIVSPGSDTKGSIAVKGTVEFYEGLTLPSSFKVTNGPPAYSLPSTQSSPTLTGGTGAILHNLKVTWDCCSKDKTATKETKVEST
jgi:hypothetical protein